MKLPLELTQKLKRNPIINCMLVPATDYVVFGLFINFSLPLKAVIASIF